ncbi:hypothetical protein LTR62_002958 [Meristemomyces frigidus]|uniref:Uncharacterized protein n=1 Tax=Meristemomyces frigidus TaxID=1508187 RepID=A0AAN7YJV5_9PEZI|nr:hypothetical protein LTR62_002958 [Meristemomyces frigidus]
MVGQVIGAPLYVFFEIRYRKKIARLGVVVTPETRLEPALWAAIFMPVGLFWLAFTTYDSIHWAVGVVGTILFGMGNVLISISMTNYLISIYSIFAATASATNALARATFAFTFPLFTSHMYHNLGPAWASAIPAFLALAFAPLPFLLLKFGSTLRARSRFANEAKARLAKLEEVRKKVDEKFEEKHAAVEKPVEIDSAGGSSA